MDELILPGQLAGPWHHALFMTYGIDIPFFEGSLWREFRNGCRNKIVLADGNQLLNAFEHYAAGGRVRMLNQQYIAEGIFTPRAAHAKLILLTHPEQGRLLVGSGNIGNDGYASGGELFTSFEVSPTSSTHLNAFLAVRQLVSTLVQDGHIQGPVVDRIERLWSETPWLFGPPTGNHWPVRHNLKDSFLSQLQETVAQEPVEELWVVSPFYDEECRALSQLLEALRPKQATLLVQRGRTSVSPPALSRVLDESPSPCKVYFVRRPTGDPYVHAKLYLLKTATRAICLQGSPNLSQVAMLLSYPHGNVELACLLEADGAHAFDYLWDQVEIQPIELTVDTLDLVYESVPIERTDLPSSYRLRGGEWFQESLILRFQGDLPSLANASLIIAEEAYPIVVQQLGSDWLKLLIDAEAAHELARPVPVFLQWGSGLDATTTNPVFICNRAALNAALSAEEARDVLSRVGDLDLDDQELEQLLAELDAALIIDGRSIWQLAGRTLPSSQDAKDGEALDYATINYEHIRQHPKVLQYLQRNTGHPTSARSRLQIILNAITDRFCGLVDLTTVTQFELDLI